MVDWSDLGQRDGQAGYPAARIERHAKACAKAGIAVDQPAYLAARSVGIRSFCTPANGLSLGRAGGRYRNSCPAELEPDFLRTYNVARNLHDARNALESARNRVDAITDRAFISDLTPEARSVLESDLIDARSDLRDAEFDLRLARLKYQRISGEIG
ncbi:MAG: DUF2799 domain-containing protein [Pseudomonadota bacterium]